MKVEKLNLENVACFKHLEINFSEGLNILIGENSTGKTVILKIVYSILEELSKVDKDTNKRRIEEDIGRKLANVFQIETVGRLSTRRRGYTKSRIKLTAEDCLIDFYFSTRNKKVEIKEIRNIEKFKNVEAVFLPPKEVLSLVKGLREIYEKREFEIEETYIDLAKKLALPPKRGKPSKDESKLIEFLSNKTGIKQVTQKDDYFYLKLKELGNSDIEAPLTAEGFRKLATLFVLIRNGTLSKGSFLFWDEPEANLNPFLSEDVAKFIKELANTGVQIFIATHDYFISKFCDFSFDGKNIKFFSLFKEGENVLYSEANKFTRLKHNPILDEFIRLYELKRKRIFSSNREKKNERMERRELTF